MGTTARGEQNRQSNEYNWDEEMAALHEKTQALNLYEFWSVGKAGEHEAVRDLARFDKAVPHIWKYADVRPCLEKAGELIDMDESERRSLIMCNPALKGLIATTTVGVLPEKRGRHSRSRAARAELEVSLSTDSGMSSTSTREPR